MWPAATRPVASPPGSRSCAASPAARRCSPHEALERYPRDRLDDVRQHVERRVAVGERCPRRHQLGRPRELSHDQSDGVVAPPRVPEVVPIPARVVRHQVAKRHRLRVILGRQLEVRQVAPHRRLDVQQPSASSIAAVAVTVLDVDRSGRTSQPLSAARARRSSPHRRRVRPPAIHHPKRHPGTFSRSASARANSTSASSIWPDSTQSSVLGPHLW
jgi:hypothetical protein